MALVKTDCVIIIAVSVVASAVLVAAVSCAPAGGNAEKLARDFAKTGLVPGKPVPGNFHKAVNRYGYSTTPGQSFFYFDNGYLQLDAARNLVTVDSMPPDMKMGTELGLTAIDITSWKGKPLFSMTKKELLKAYGKPSEEILSTGGNPPNKFLMYYYSVDANKLISISLIFPTAGPDVEKLYSTGFSMVDDYEVSAIQAKKATVYPWPKGI
jgi:hypothetical protein